MKHFIIIMVVFFLGGMAMAEEVSAQKSLVHKKTGPAIQKADLKVVVQKNSAMGSSNSKASNQPADTKATKTVSAPALSSALKKAQYKKTGYSSTGISRGTTGFFSLSIGHEALPIRSFAYHGTNISFRYGGYLSEQSGFEGGIRWGILDAWFIVLKYNYDWITHRRWTPGLDVSVMVGTYPYRHSNRQWLDLGLEIGPYIKSFISRSHALVLRTGLAYDTSLLTVPNLVDLRLYLSLGIQWHF